MLDIEVTKEAMGDGDEIVHLTVIVGDVKKGIALDFGANPTPQKIATALRILAMTLDPPELNCKIAK